MLQQKIAVNEEKAKFAEDVAAQAITTAQEVIGTVPQHSAQIEELQK